MSNHSTQKNPAPPNWRKIARWTGWIALLVSPIILAATAQAKHARESRPLDSALQAESAKEARAIAEMNREIQRRGNR